MFLSFCTVFLSFVIYSLIGWIAESVYCSILEKKIVNRGFLNGPFCPIYGVGALIVVYGIGALSDNIFVVFLLGMVFTSVLEYFTGWLMETVFHHKWWDYSNHKINIRGRVCLTNTILFGLAAVGVTFLHPLTQRMLSNLPVNAHYAAAVVIGAYMLWDFVFTVGSIIRMNVHLGQAHRLALVRLVKEGPIAYRHSAFQRRLLDAFPQIRSIRYEGRMKELKETITAFRNERRQARSQKRKSRKEADGHFTEEKGGAL